MLGRKPLVLAGVSVLVSVPLVLAGATSSQGAELGVTLSSGRVLNDSLQVNSAVVWPNTKVEVRAVQSAGLVTVLEPVQKECGNCLAGINGDFYNLTSHQPIGGVIIGGIVLRSPNQIQNQLTIGPKGHISAGIMDWSGELITHDGRTQAIAVNSPTVDGVVLYNSSFGPTTPADANATELAFTAPHRGLRLSSTLWSNFAGLHTPGTAISPDQFILQATGAARADVEVLAGYLRSHPRRHKVRLIFRTTPKARDSLGANYVLLKDGQSQAIAEDTNFVHGSHPRTLFGWNKRGEVFLSTVGSSTPGRRLGVTLDQAAAIMAAQGATDAVNLDGGGSSTFVNHGRVINNPSDGYARSVTNAWVVRLKPGVEPPPPSTTVPTTTTTTTIPKPPPSSTTTTVAVTTTTKALSIEKPVVPPLSKAKATKSAEAQDSTSAVWKLQAVAIALVVTSLITLIVIFRPRWKRR